MIDHIYPNGVAVEHGFDRSLQLLSLPIGDGRVAVVEALRQHNI